MLRDRIAFLFSPETKGPMRYALDMRTFWFSHYLSTGLRTSFGIMAVALGALLLLPQMPQLAMSMAFGAACLALVDQTGPLYGKARELGVSLAVNTIASLWVGLLTSHPFWQTVSILLITFGSAFLLLYGKRAMPVQFAMLLAMTLSAEHVDKRPDVWMISGGFFAGGLLYLLYTVAISWWGRQRSKQQVLAEALFELASYFDTKSRFYERKVDIDAQFTALIRQQVVLAERQQSARDLVLQRERQADAQDGALIQIHLRMLDVYEQILSTHTDYQALHLYFGHSDVLLFLRDLVRKATADVEAVAYAVTRGRPSESPVSYTAEKRAIEYELHLLQQQVQQGQFPPTALTLLRSTYYKIMEVIARLGALHAATHAAQVQLPELNLRLFVSRPRLNWPLLRRNLSLQSPIMRYGIRISLAMLAAILMGAVLPYAAHAYWIMLTIAIIMKPSYSMTRERRTKRMVGTALGCVLAAVVLQWVQSPVALLVVLFLSLTVSATFVQIRYIYTAAAATLTVMILLHFTSSSAGGNALAERLMDTLTGVLIASVFSHVFPSWERQTMPHLLGDLFDAARQYLRDSHALLLNHAGQDQAYRLARKQFLGQIANVNGTVLRMLDEPKNRQKGIAAISQLLVRTYLMTSHVAALRMLLRRQPWLRQNAAFQHLVEQSMRQADGWLAQAQQELQAQNGAGYTPPSAPGLTGSTNLDEPSPGLDDPQDGAAPATQGASPTWLDAALDEQLMPGSAQHTRNVLCHRITALQEDARQLVHHSRAVSKAMGWAQAGQ